jgi:hypothetical protein
VRQGDDRRARQCAARRRAHSIADVRDRVALVLVDVRCRREEDEDDEQSLVSDVQHVHLIHSLHEMQLSRRLSRSAASVRSDVDAKSLLPPSPPQVSGLCCCVCV